MIPDKKFLEIAKGLLEKTKQKKVAWEKGDAIGARSGPRQEPENFLFRLPNSIVCLGFAHRTVGDFVVLTVNDSKGNIAGTWEVEEGQDEWPLAYELYLEISKQVNKWDKVLAEVEDFIGKQ